MTLHHEEAEQIFQQLWDLGFRPSNGEGSAGQLAATERHLSEMSAIANKTLDALVWKRGNHET
jgi:hypothetical protein